MAPAWSGRWELLIMGRVTGNRGVSRDTPIRIDTVPMVERVVSC